MRIAVVTCFVIATTVLKLRNADQCITPNYETARCISLYDCPKLLDAVSTIRSDPIVRVFLRRSHCGCTSAEPMVCCGAYSNFIPTAGTDLESKKICGLQHSDDLGYNHSGNDTLLTEHPWLALIGYKIRGTNKVSFRCAGSLINKKYVLTAASCIPFQDMGLPERVRLGEHNTKTEEDCLQDERVYECSDSTQDYGVDDSIAHQEYHSRITGIHNIGLIKINGTVEYSDYIRPICLPLVDLTTTKSEDQLIISGWKNGGELKQKTSGKPITYQKCNDELPVHYTIHEGGQACGLFVSDERSDVTCNYYLGSPVTYSRKLQWTQEGMFVSCFWAYQSSSSYLYVYTNVAYYVDWIQINIKWPR